MKELNDNNELNGQNGAPAENTATPAKSPKKVKAVKPSEPKASEAAPETAAATEPVSEPVTETAAEEVAATEAKPEKQGKKKAATEKKPEEEKLYKLPFIKNPVKKITLIRIICIAAAAVVAVVALTLGLVLGLRGSNTCEVVFENCEHVEYTSVLIGEEAVDANNGGKFSVNRGKTVTFTLSVEEGYSQQPYVTANETALELSEGKYSFTVTEDTTVKISEVFEVAVTLEGQGTESAPWILRSAREINFVAEQVNFGNPYYIQGYYALDGDIDCNGAALNVIGNGRSQYSFFGGFVDGNGHTISNFVINANNMSYAGLFGYVQSSGTGTDDLGTIKNLNLSDFTLTAHAPDAGNVFAGSFIGYSLAAQLINCGADNGTINVLGSMYFSYVGGAIGAQQSATATATDGSLYPFYSIVNKVHTNVDIIVGSGYVYGAGGITGFVYSDHEIAQGIITNCYSEGDIFGAIRAGGIAGILDDYSSIANCYSTGEIEAYTEIENDEYGTVYDAFAGGIAGYAGVNTIISDSFTSATLYAGANDKKFTHTGDIAGGYDEATLASRALVIHNSERVSATPTASYVKNTLGWKELDWNITDGSYPTLNPVEPAQNDNKVTIVLNYSGYSVEGNNSDTVTVTLYPTYYSPLSDYMDDNNGYVTDDGLTSYGYFFDAAHTQQVPYGYVPTGSVTLYIAFADYSKVEGTYYYNKNGRTVSITLETTGEYIYHDVGTYSSSYTYDGATIIIYDALFARLCDKVIDDSPNLNYEQYNFVGIAEVEGIKFYDGNYFTESEPIVFTGTTAPKNKFVGTWEMSATIKQSITFTSSGWSSTKSLGGAMSGTYTESDDGANLGNGIKAKINNYNLLEVTLANGNTQTYCYENSLFGTWFDISTGNYVMFDGYGTELYGVAVVNLYNSTQTVYYVRDGFFDEGNRKSVTLLDPDTLSLYGYLMLDGSLNTLSGVLYSTASGGYVEANNFYLVDDYVGEWITHVDGKYKVINFNGFGSYEVLDTNGVPEKLGYVEIDGTRYIYTIDLDNELRGSFFMGTTEYILTFDVDSRTVTISESGSAAENYSRKDIMYETPLIDAAGNIYTFNGGGNLSAGGELVVTLVSGDTQTYNYKIKDSEIDENNYLRDINIDLDDGNGGAGTISVSGTKFLFEAGGTSATLSFNLPYSGNRPWAINGYMRNITIGYFDLSYTATGTFADVSTTYTYDKEGGYVYCEYITGEMTGSVMEYLFLLDDNNMVVSSYPYLVAGDYLYAARQDEYFLGNGWYETTSSGHVFKFDGVADSKYVNGIVYEYMNNVEINYYYYTRRFGKIYMWQYDDESVMYVFETVAYTAEGDGIYNNGGRSSFKLVEFVAEEETVCSVKDGSTVYEFYLDGSLKKDGKSGSYELIDVNGNVTQLIIHVAGEADRTAEVNTAENTITFIDK